MAGIMELLPKKSKTDYIVIVSDGLKGKPYPITEIVGYNEGYALRYKNGDDKLDVVYVSRQFRFLEYEGKYLLGKRLGNNSGCEIDFEGAKIKEGIEVIGPSTDPDCPGEDLSSLVRTDVLAIGYSTLTESKVSRKLIIIIIIAVIVIAIIYFIMKR
jgi:hypothetical protein